MHKHARPFNSAADARIRACGHTERVIATGTSGGTHAFAALRHEGVAAAPGMVFGILSRTSGSCPKMNDEGGFAVLWYSRGQEGKNGEPQESKNLM